MYMYMHTCMQSICNQMVVLESTFKGPQFKAEEGLGLFFVLKKTIIVVKYQFFNLSFWNLLFSGWKPGYMIWKSKT